MSIKYSPCLNILLCLPFNKDVIKISLKRHRAIRTESRIKSFNPITGETQQRFVGLITIIDGKGYSIATVAPDAKFSNCAPIFGRMIYSFKVNA